ncbi:MAG: head completion/stabilization protein [Parashewanella sp.]
MSFGHTPKKQASITLKVGNGWPELSTGEFKANRRIPSQFEEDALANSIARSAKEVKKQLVEYIDAALKRNKDYQPEFKFVDDKPEFDELEARIFTAAVYQRSHADLMSYFATVDHKEDKDTDEQRNSLLAESNLSIRTLLGLSRTGVHSL